jgi:hypothetical protein
MIETFACATFYLISELKLGQSIELFSVAPQEGNTCSLSSAGREKPREPRGMGGDDAIVVDEW